MSATRLLRFSSTLLVVALVIAFTSAYGTMFVDNVLPAANSVTYISGIESKVVTADSVNFDELSIKSLKGFTLDTPGPAILNGGTSVSIISSSLNLGDGTDAVEITSGGAFSLSGSAVDLSAGNSINIISDSSSSFNSPGNVNLQAQSIDFATNGGQGDVTFGSASGDASIIAAGVMSTNADTNTFTSLYDIRFVSDFGNVNWQVGDQFTVNANFGALSSFDSLTFTAGDTLSLSADAVLSFNSRVVQFNPENQFYTESQFEDVTFVTAATLFITATSGPISVQTSNSINLNIFGHTQGYFDFTSTNSQSFFGTTVQFISTGPVYKSELRAENHDWNTNDLSISSIDTWLEFTNVNVQSTTGLTFSNPVLVEISSGAQQQYNSGNNDLVLSSGQTLNVNSPTINFGSTDSITFDGTTTSFYSQTHTVSTSTSATTYAGTTQITSTAASYSHTTKTTLDINAGALSITSGLGADITFDTPTLQITSGSSLVITAQHFESTQQTSLTQTTNGALTVSSLSHQPTYFFSDGTLLISSGGQVSITTLENMWVAGVTSIRNDDTITITRVNPLSFHFTNLNTDDLQFSSSRDIFFDTTSFTITTVNNDWIATNSINVNTNQLSMTVTNGGPLSLASDIVSIDNSQRIDPMALTSTATLFNGNTFIQGLGQLAISATGAATINSKNTDIQVFGQANFQATTLSFTSATSFSTLSYGDTSITADTTITLNPATSTTFNNNNGLSDNLLSISSTTGVVSIDSLTLNLNANDAVIVQSSTVNFGTNTLAQVSSGATLTFNSQTFSLGYGTQLSVIGQQLVNFNATTGSIVIADTLNTNFAASNRFQVNATDVTMTTTTLGSFSLTSGELSIDTRTMNVNSQDTSFTGGQFFGLTFESTEIISPVITFTIAQSFVLLSDSMTLTTKSSSLDLTSTFTSISTARTSLTAVSGGDISSQGRTSITATETVKYESGSNLSMDFDSDVLFYIDTGASNLNAGSGFIFDADDDSFIDVPGAVSFQSLNGGVYIETSSFVGSSSADNGDILVQAFGQVTLSLGEDLSISASGAVNFVAGGVFSLISDSILSIGTSTSILNINAGSSLSFLSSGTTSISSTGVSTFTSQESIALNGLGVGITATNSHLRIATGRDSSIDYTAAGDFSLVAGSDVSLSAGGDFSINSLGFQASGASVWLMTRGGPISITGSSSSSLTSTKSNIALSSGDDIQVTSTSTITLAATDSFSVLSNAGRVLFNGGTISLSATSQLVITADGSRQTPLDSVSFNSVTATTLTAAGTFNIGATDLVAIGSVITPATVNLIGRGTSTTVGLSVQSQGDISLSTGAKLTVSSGVAAGATGLISSLTTKSTSLTSDGIVSLDASSIQIGALQGSVRLQGQTVNFLASQVSGLASGLIELSATGTSPSNGVVLSSAGDIRLTSSTTQFNTVALTGAITGPTTFSVTGTAGSGNGRASFNTAPGAGGSISLGSGTFTLSGSNTITARTVSQGGVMTVSGTPLQVYTTQSSSSIILRSGADLSATANLITLLSVGTMTFDSRDSTGHNLGTMSFNSAGIISVNANGQISLDGSSQVGLRSGTSTEYDILGQILVRASQSIGMSAGGDFSTLASGNLVLQNSPTSNGNITLSAGTGLTIDGGADTEWTVRGNLFSTSSNAVAWAIGTQATIETLGTDADLLFSTGKFLTPTIAPGDSITVSITASTDLSGKSGTLSIMSNNQIQFSAGTLLNVISTSSAGNIVLASTDSKVTLTASPTESMNIQATGTSTNQGHVTFIANGFTTASPIGTAISATGTLQMSAADSIRFSSHASTLLTSTASSTLQAQSLLSLRSTGTAGGQLSVESNKITINSGPMALYATSPVEGQLSFVNSIVGLSSTQGQSWLAQSSATVSNSQANIFIGSTQAHSLASVGLTFFNTIRLQSAGQMQLLSNLANGAPVSFSAGNSIVVEQTGKSASNTDGVGIEFRAAYGDIQVFGGEAYLSSVKSLSVTGLDAITFECGTSMTLVGGQTLLNSRQGDVVVTATQSITMQATTQRISTAFQEIGSKFNIVSRSFVLDMIDLLAIISDATLVSENGSVVFGNDVYAMGYLSIPTIPAQGNIAGQACVTVNSLVITNDLNLVPRLCVCDSGNVWRCSTSIPF